MGKFKDEGKRILWERCPYCEDRGLECTPVISDPATLVFMMGIRCTSCGVKAKDQVGDLDADPAAVESGLVSRCLRRLKAGVTVGGKKERPLDKMDFERMGIPMELRCAHGPQVPEAFAVPYKNFRDEVDDYVRNGVTVLLSGPPGVGKSCIATLWMRKAKARSYSAYFLTTWGLRQARRNRAQFDLDTSVFSRCREVDLLVLDGLSQEDMRDPIFGFPELLNLVRFRSSGKKATIITDNLTGPSDLDAAVDVSSALCRGVSRMIALVVGGPNQRSRENMGWTTRIETAREGKDGGAI